MKYLMWVIGFILVSEFGIVIFNWMKDMEEWKVRTLYYVCGAACIGVQYMVNKWIIQDVQLDERLKRQTDQFLGKVYGKDQSNPLY